MSTPRRHQRQDLLDAISPQTRAAAVLVGALTVGALVLNGVPASPSPGPVAARATVSVATVPPAAATPTTAPLHDPASVTVLVLNGVDPTKSIAKPAAMILVAGGFTTLPPGDAKKTVAASAVYYLDGFEVDARAIAARLGVPPVSVRFLPVPAPIEVGDIGAAAVVVVIGPDLSGPAPSAAN